MSETKSAVSTAKIIVIWCATTLGVAALFCILLAGASVAYARLYQNRIFPGVRVLGVRLDGLTRDEAQAAVQKAVDQSLQNGLQFTYNGQSVTLDAASPATNPDEARDLVSYDIQPAIDAAFAEGRQGNAFVQAEQQVQLRIDPADIPAHITIDQPDIMGELASALDGNLKTPHDAALVVASGTSPVRMEVSPESSGQVIDPGFLTTLQAQAQALSFSPIALTEDSISPNVHAADLSAALAQANSILARPALAFIYQDQTFNVPMSAVASWIVATSTTSSPGLVAGFDPNAFVASMRVIAPTVEQTAKDGSIVTASGTVVSFTAGVDGIAIDGPRNVAELAQWPASTTLPLAVDRTPANLAASDPSLQGIKQIIGVGTSNFGNSPPNRIKNIDHGISLVNGTVVPAGATFSLVSTLGSIDEAHGWLPELVIKNDETTPDFGGGLCQIGTTTFRAALATGLPIVERQNHSYRVSYYEPAGTDATIYDPEPDFKFQNDMANPILIHAYRIGSKVIFEFWGTPDGRSATSTYPTIYNIVQPPPTKLEETLSLPPGKKQCSEIAHAGADADFTYTVTYADGTVKSRVFHSHYKPWQAVCLIGVTKLSDPTATSTTP